MPKHAGKLATMMSPSGTRHRSGERPMKVLLHICCGPCAIYPLKALRSEGHEVTGYFFNPNIHPYTEFEKRLDTLRTYAGGASLPLVIDDTYDLEPFLKGAMEYGRERCSFCYRTRLGQTFRHAEEQGFDAVTTTLLYSKYQKHGEIVSIASVLSEEYDVPFLYEDFRIGWQEGVDASRQLNMYRQKYCGCIFSEHENRKRKKYNAG